MAGVEVIRNKYLKDIFDDKYIFDTRCLSNLFQYLLQSKKEGEHQEKE